MPEPDCLMLLVSDMLALGDDHDALDLALGGRQGLLEGGFPRRIDRGDGAGGEGKDQNQVFRSHGYLPGVDERHCRGGGRRAASALRRAAAGRDETAETRDERRALSEEAS